jgi:hypothetical protein
MTSCDTNTTFPGSIDEIAVTILLNTEDATLMSLCNSSTKYAKICSTQEFWKRKIEVLMGKSIPMTDKIDFKKLYRELHNKISVAHGANYLIKLYKGQFVYDLINEGRLKEAEFLLKYMTLDLIISAIDVFISDPSEVNTKLLDKVIKLAPNIHGYDKDALKYINNLKFAGELKAWASQLFVDNGATIQYNNK